MEQKGESDKASSEQRLGTIKVTLTFRDCEEGRMPKNWCRWTVVLEKTLESPLDSKEIKSVNLKGDPPWIFIGRTDTEAEVPVFWWSDANRWHIGKGPDAGKDWGQNKGASEDEMAGWHTNAMNMNLGKLWEMVRDREAWCARVHRVTNSRTLLATEQQQLHGHGCLGCFQSDYNDWCHT